MSLLIVGDAHGSHKTPVSRMDDYSETFLRKLADVFSIARARHCAHIVFLGDVFNSSEVYPTWFLGRVFAAFKNSGVVSICLPGNHDLPYDRFEYLGRSTLGLLANAGLCGVPGPGQVLTLGNMRVCFAGLGQREDLGAADILCAHAFYKQSYDDPYFVDESTVDGYGLVFLGHDHTPYAPLVLKSGTVVHRPGSLTRSTSHFYQFDRPVQVCYVSDTGAVEYLSIDHDPAEAVLRKDMSKEVAVDRRDLSKFIDSVVADHRQSGVGLSTFISGLGLDAELYKYVTTRLAEYGYFTN